MDSLVNLLKTAGLWSFREAPAARRCESFFIGKDTMVQDLRDILLCTEYVLVSVTCEPVMPPGHDRECTWPPDKLRFYFSILYFI